MLVAQAKAAKFLDDAEGLDPLSGHGPFAQCHSGVIDEARRIVKAPTYGNRGFRVRLREVRADEDDDSP
jgi:hypothetical protein